MVPVVCGCVATGLCVCVLLPLVNSGWGTWDAEDQHVLVMGENQQLHFVSMLCYPSDASLTLPNVLAAVRTVQDVGTLGGVLGVPGTKRDEVVQQSGSDDKMREGLVKYYMDTFPNASWEHLGGRLLYWGKDAALEEVKVHIKPTEGEHGLSNDMCQCCASWLGQ